MILNSSTTQLEPVARHLQAPGVPPGPIPDLSSDEEDADEDGKRSGVCLFFRTTPSFTSLLKRLCQATLICFINTYKVASLWHTERTRHIQAETLFNS